jgi:SAM-dependent methyltransferase
MGWLRVLSEWVGSQGRVTGTDIDERMLGLARDFVQQEGLANVSLITDDLFQTRLPARSFDLVHARFQIAPLGRASDQVRAYCELLRPGGILVLEDPEMGSWRVNPDAPACERLIGLIADGFRTAGGDFNAGRALPSLMRAQGLAPEVRSHVVALPPGHPYLRLPLQFATSLRARLEAAVGDAELDRLMVQAEAELASPDAWGTTFTLVQAFARV